MVTFDLVKNSRRTLILSSGMSCIRKSLTKRVLVLFVALRNLCQRKRETFIFTFCSIEKFVSTGKRILIFTFVAYEQEEDSNRSKCDFTL